MPKKFLFFLSLKTGALIMALINIACGISFIIGGSLVIADHDFKDIKLYLIVCILMGVFNIFSGSTLILAIIQGKERTILFYILLELVNLFILSIFSGINMVAYESIGLIALFCFCGLLWYGLYCMYSFYMEMAEFNSVKSGAIEISCNANINPIMHLPEKAIDSTAV